MHFTAAFAAAVAAAGVAEAGPVYYNPMAHLTPRQANTLNAALRAKGNRYAGTSLTIRNDNTETNIIKSEFSSITPENAMKWDSTESSRGNFNLGGGDQYVNWAQQNKFELRCHTLVWHSQLPSWVSNSNFDKNTLQSVMQTHINTLMGRWKGKCTHWDVVNEALNEDGSYRSSVFYRVLGDQFIPIAFKMAAAADPSAKLFYNDYNLEYDNAKTAGALRIVKLVQAAGYRIDGVGFQGHLTVGTTPTNQIDTPSVAVLEKSLRYFTDLELDVAYTELDIRMTSPFTDSKIAQHAAAYTRVFQACLNVKRCIGVTVWGVLDKYSWVPGTFNGEGYALLWNDNGSKKSAYTSVLNAINAMNGTGT